MPFTLAHPAAAIPLRHRLGSNAVLSALVIGSMVPDFSYFLPFGIPRSQSHSLLGLFWFCMPVGLISYWLFHRWLARPIVDLLPVPMRTRLLPVIEAHTRAPLRAVLASLFVGAVTHIAWDAFTHAGAPIVRVSRALRFHLMTLSGYPISVYTVLQHVSTVLGIGLVVVWSRRWLRAAEPDPSAAASGLSPHWRSAAIASVLALTVLFLTESHGLRPIREYTLHGVQMFLRRAVPFAISSLSAALLLYAAAWQLVQRFGRRGLPVLLIPLCALLATAASAAAPPVFDAIEIASRYDQVLDVPYGTPNETSRRLDLTLLRDGGSRPTVVLFHGGGWVGHRKETDALALLPYLARGFNAVNVEYRTAPEAPAPAAVVDCRCALRFLAARGKQYGIDAAQLVLTGHSAGGQLALITGMLPEGSEFDRDCPYEERARVAAIVDWSGVTDVADLLAGANAREFAQRWLAGAPEPEALARRLSPVAQVRAGLPPILVLHGDADDVVPYAQAERLVAALRAAGSRVELVTLRGEKHGLYTTAAAQQGYARLFAFLGEAGVSPR